MPYRRSTQGSSKSSFGNGKNKPSMLLYLWEANFLKILAHSIDWFAWYQGTTLWSCFTKFKIERVFLIGTFQSGVEAMCGLVQTPLYVYNDLAVWNLVRSVLFSFENGWSYRIQEELHRSVLKRWFDWASIEVFISNCLEMAVKLLRIFLSPKNCVFVL